MRLPNRTISTLALALAAGLVTGPDGLAQRGGAGRGSGGSVSRPSGGSSRAGGSSRPSVSRPSVSRPSSSRSSSSARPPSGASGSPSTSVRSVGSRPSVSVPSTSSARRVTRSSSPSVRYVPREDAGHGSSVQTAPTRRTSSAFDATGIADRSAPERGRETTPRTIDAPGVIDFGAVGAPPPRRPFPRPYGSSDRSVDRGASATARSGFDTTRGGVAPARTRTAGERSISPSDILERYRGDAEKRVADQDPPARRRVHASDVPKLARERLAAAERPRGSRAGASDLRTRSERIEALRRQRGIRESGADGGSAAIASARSLERGRALDTHHGGGYHDYNGGCHDWCHEQGYHFSCYSGFYFGFGWSWCWYWYYPYWWWNRYYCWPYYTGYPVYVTRTVYVDDGSYTAAPAEQEVVYVEAAPQEDVLVGEGVAAAPASDPALSRQLARAADYYLELGDRAFREGRYGDAVHFYAKAVEYAPERGILYLILADALFATGDYHYAAYALRQAFELEPELASTGIDKHAFYADPREFDRQLAVLELYLEDHFLDEDARLVLAVNYCFGGRPQAAVELLESAFSLDVAQSSAGSLVLDAARGTLEPRRQVEPEVAAPGNDER